MHYGDVLIKFGEILDVRKEQLPMILDECVLTKYKSSFLQNGDVIVADTAEDSTVGKCSEIAGVNDEVVLSGLHTIPYRPVEKFASGYLGYYLNSSAYHNQLIPLMQGIKVTSISKSAMQDTNIIYPKSKEEQARIGEYFLTLDTLITLHQRKKYDRRVIIIYVWEQRKVSEITSSYSGGTPKAGTAEYYDGNIPFIRSGEIYSDTTELFITEEGLNSSSAKMVHIGDILYALYGATSGEVSRAKLDGAINQAILAIIPNDEVNADFLVEWFRKEKAQITDKYLQGGQGNLSAQIIKDLKIIIPMREEQNKMGEYFSKVNHLITLHQCKCNKWNENVLNVWEQRKFGDLGSVAMCKRIFKEQTSADEDIPFYKIGTFGAEPDAFISRELFEEYREKFQYPNIGDMLISASGTIGRTVEYKGEEAYFQDSNIVWFKHDDRVDNSFLKCIYEIVKWSGIEGSTIKRLYNDNFLKTEFSMPKVAEQQHIGMYFQSLDHLITLHQYKHLNSLTYCFCTLIQCKCFDFYYINYIFIRFSEKEMEKMSELESVIEKKLIDQLVYGDSQWTYREDLKTEEDLWKNFKYILEQNNKDRLNGELLSDTEFEQVKNQLQFSSFYKAGEWLVGENGKVMVHVQRNTEKIHLVVMNHEHIAGGSSVYEVINQYSALKSEDEDIVVSRDRRFDVTLMINGLPMIHIELKNKQHSCMDSFNQIKKYIGEGKFTGIFSAVQMFVISNAVDTKYFSAASDTELNPKFMSSWLDENNNVVSDYLDFARCVLKIPEAHEMIARYTVLDEDAKRLILLRPYQIHAIESIREASKIGKSGFVWHTTGSGKTLTSYKATRNLLMDIPSIDKTIFLIDRKDLDAQTTMAFQAYANNDLVDVDNTDNVNDLKRKLKSDDRQVIVTTIQKLHILISKKLQEGTPEYNKIKNLKIAYVVDECHRAVTPGTKRELERFFGNSLWFGFTGTPRFAENAYPQMGDLPRTTEELYGECLHKYTIQNAIHDKAVLGFQVEHNGPKNIEIETDSRNYDNETHMLRVLDIILNKSFYKLGFQNGKGKTYEGLLTTSSIQMAQKYYDLLLKIKNGQSELKIDEKIKRILPDFPKFAITYSISENEESSQVNQQKMQDSLDDYNSMFGTKYDLTQIQGYNSNLNKRLARKDSKFERRSEQLDLVIVVDRLLTGFDAPCMSTIFIDRQPMGPHDLIQAFSRTNRIFDAQKNYGQVVTFQAPKLFKQCVDDAVKLYSAGSTEEVMGADWEQIKEEFRKSLKALRIIAPKPSDVPKMSDEEKKQFVKLFQSFDKFFSQFKSFTQYDESMLEEYGITQDEYDDYAAHYLNVMDILRKPTEPGEDPDGVVIDQDYELMAYSNTKIDYEYIIHLIQNIVMPSDQEIEITPEERQKKFDEVKQYIEELRRENPKVAELMKNVVSDIELDEKKYKGQSILNIVENMKRDCIDRVISEFCLVWYASKEDVMYAATHYRNGVIPNESAIKATIDYTSYKEAQENALPKFKFYNQMISELRKTLDEEIKPLITH